MELPRKELTLREFLLKLNGFSNDVSTATIPSVV